MADSAVNITAGSGTPIRVLTALGAGSADQQVVTLADSAGNLLGTAGAPIPVSLATNTPTIAAGTNQIGTVGELRASTLAVTVTAASAAAATLTLPAAGAGLFHYLTALDICLYSAAARTGSATPWIVTTTNLPGTPSWDFSTAGAIGATERQWLTPTTPLKSSAANTATTVVGPAATGGIWRITATYFTGV